MISFDDLWREVCQRSASFPVVQEYNELKHVFDLMREKECDSYLEVGTAEGNSLFVLSHALKPGARITYIDFDEPHTRTPRNQIVGLLRSRGYVVEALHGNTMDQAIIEKANEASYDCVMIDAGHSYDEVLSDAKSYAHLGEKLVLFHDVMLPDVKAAFEDFNGIYRTFRAEADTFIRSETFGYGILTV